jgi:nucleotide-binding universal stress UspA family protein
VALRAEHLPRPDLAYRKIVVPLGGQEAQPAVSVAAQLAAERGAEITAVVVIELPVELPLEAHMDAEEARAQRLLEEARAIAGAHGVRLRARVVRGREAGEEVVAEANALGADLIVLEAATRPPALHSLFGKTADYILKHAECRVLLVSPPTGP